MSTVLELLWFLKSRKKYWLWPVMIISVLFGVLLVLAQTSAVAPFIYSLY